MELTGGKHANAKKMEYHAYERKKFRPNTKLEQCDFFCQEKGTVTENKKQKTTGHNKVKKTNRNTC